MAEENGTPPVLPAAEAETEQDRDCVWCERMPGAVAVFAAGVIGFIGLDLLTGGALSRFVGGLLGRGGQAEEEGGPPGD